MRKQGSAVPRDFGWCWTCVSGWGRVASQGCPGVQADGGLPDTQIVVDKDGPDGV